MKTIKLEIKATITKSVIPTRCRNQRTFYVTGSYTVALRTITTDEAPIAFQWRGHSYNENWQVHERRLFRGKLYRPVISRYSGKRDRHLGLSSLTENSSVDSLFQPIPPGAKIVADNLEETRQVAQEGLNRELLIEGKRWEVCEEPRYYILTQGLGCDHGATSLNVDESYNSNIPGKHYFRADQFRQAEAYMRHVAASRGDVKNVFSLKPSDRIKVSIPAAIRLKRNNQPGCAFLNKIEACVRRAKNPGIAGLLTVVGLNCELTGKPI